VFIKAHSPIVTILSQVSRVCIITYHDVTSRSNTTFRSKPQTPIVLIASRLANTVYTYSIGCTFFHISTNLEDFPSIVKTVHDNILCFRPRFCRTHFACLQCTRTCRKRAKDTILSALQFRSCLQSMCVFFFSLSLSCVLYPFLA